MKLVALCQQRIFPSSAYSARARVDVWRPMSYYRLASRSFPVKRFPARWNWDVKPGVKQSRVSASRASGATRAVAFSPAGYANVPGADPEHSDMVLGDSRAREARRDPEEIFQREMHRNAAPVGWLG